MSTTSIPMANLRLSVNKLNSVTPARNRNRESGRRLTKSSPPEVATDLSEVTLEDEPIPWCELHCKRTYKIACFVTLIALAIITIIVLIVYYQTHDVSGQGKKPATVNRKDTYPYGSAPPSWTESVDNGPILRTFGSDKKTSREFATPVTETSPFSENSNATEALSTKTSTSSTEDSVNNSPKSRDFGSDMKRSENASTAVPETSPFSENSNATGALSTKTSTSSTEDSINNGPKLRDFGSDMKRSENASTAVPETSPFSEKSNATEALSTKTSTSSTEDTVDNVPKLRDFGSDIKTSQNSTTAVMETNMSSSGNSSMSEALTTRTTSTTEETTKSMSDNETKPEQTTEEHAAHQEDANSSPAPNLKQKGRRKWSTLPESNEESITSILAANATNYKIDSDKKSRMLNNEVRKRPIILTTVHENAVNFNLPVYHDASTVSPLNVIDEKPTTQSQDATNNSETRGSLFSQIHAHIVNLFGENPTEKPKEIHNLSTASFKNENVTSTESSGTFTHSLLSTDESSNTINLHNFPKNSTSDYENSRNVNSSKISVNFTQTLTTDHFNEQNLSSLKFGSSEFSEISRVFNTSTTAPSNFDQNLSLLDNLTDLSINSTSTNIFGNSQTLNQNFTVTPGFNKTSTSSFEISTTTTHFSEQTSPSQNLSWTDGEISQNLTNLTTPKNVPESQTAHNFSKTTSCTSECSPNSYNSDYDNVTSFNRNLTVLVLDMNSSNFSNDVTFTNISTNVLQDAAVVVARTLSSSSTTSPNLMNSSINSERNELDAKLTPV